MAISTRILYMTVNNFCRPKGEMGKFRTGKKAA